MAKKININKLTLWILVVLFVIAAFQIFAYFFYIYKPASNIVGSVKSNLLEIPAVSQILTPRQITNQSMNLTDVPRDFYPGNLDNFASTLKSKVTDDRTFIKNSSADYILGGTVDNIKKNSDGGVSITLKNSTSNKITETFTADEIANIKVLLLFLSPETPTNSEANINDALPGDYMVIKKSVNLLENSAAFSTEIELFRTPK